MIADEPIYSITSKITTTLGFKDSHREQLYWLALSQPL